jgi:hypothetical protein
MPIVGLEPTIPVLEPAKTFHALESAITLIRLNWIEGQKIRNGPAIRGLWLLTEFRRATCVYIRTVQGTQERRKRAVLIHDCMLRMHMKLHIPCMMMCAYGMWLMAYPCSCSLSLLACHIHPAARQKIHLVTKATLAVTVRSWVVPTQGTGFLLRLVKSHSEMIPILGFLPKV